MRTPGKRFEIESREHAGKLLLQVSGVIGENADLTLLTGATATDLEIDMQGVRRVNSFGVRAWIDAVRKIPGTTRLVFVHCPPPVIDQCNMVPGFLGHGTIRSFYAPMTCEDCDEQLEQLFDTARCAARGGTLPAVPCPRCGLDMELDDLEDQYLLFLRDG